MVGASEYLELKDLLPNADIRNGVDILDDVMLIKDAAEIERLRFAAHVADKGFNAGRNAVRAGVTENSVAGAIDKANREIGRASGEERVCQSVSISVGAGSLKKKNHNGT